MLALLVLAACTQNELLQESSGNEFPGVITFSSPYTATRSDALRSGSFKQGDQVGVLGYCKAENKLFDSDGRPVLDENGNQVTEEYHDSPWDTKKEFAEPEVFYNQMLEYQDNGVWTYNWAESGNIGGLHPWHEEDDDYTYSFFAYYPYAQGTPRNDERQITINGVNMGSIKLSGETSKGDPTITYTMAHNLGSSDGSGCNWWVVPDFMLAYRVDHKHADGSVHLNFRHIFSAIEFEVNNYNRYGITLEDFYFGGGDGNSSSRTAGFYHSVTVTGQENDYTVSEGDIYIGRFKLVGRQNNEDEHILTDLPCPAATEDAGGNIIPSTTSLAYNGKSITLFFIPSKTGALTTDDNESLYVRLGFTVDTGGTIGDSSDKKRIIDFGNQSFQPGVRSIFSINVIGSDIYVQVRSDGTWENSGDSDIIFE